MGTESFNALPPKTNEENLASETSNVALHSPEGVTQQAFPVSAETLFPVSSIEHHREDQASIVESQETDESLEDAIRNSLQNVSDSIDRLGWTLKDREDRGLNELTPTTSKGALRASSSSLKELSIDSRLAPEDVTRALGGIGRALENFGDPLSLRGPFREDAESLRRIGSAIHLAQDALLTLSSRVARHPEESFRQITNISIHIRRKMEEAMNIIARRHRLVDQYSGRR